MSNEKKRLTIIVLVCLLVYLLVDGYQPQMKAAIIDVFDPLWNSAKREGEKKASGQ